ncbi:MAG: RNA-binding protein [Rothia sp. (in: high G+C Gram-positive bacteria)]|nr:RNA-binding protein [Rothia sp. (in: high G+C Gram-positive bacteria)]
MGLRTPENLEDWRRWSASKYRLRQTGRRIKAMLGKASNEAEQGSLQFGIFTRGEEQDPARVLVALESASPTVIAALLLPAERAAERGISSVVVASESLATLVGERGYRKIATFSADAPFVPQSLENVEQVIAAGHYMAVGEWSYVWARRLNWGFNVVQHGLTTPFAPPLPANSTLFAFNQADADFWISGRTDVEAKVVGSQLFYEAHQKPSVPPEEIAKTPVFLGQMHGAELPRASFAWASFKFCQKYGAMYRPHPSEKDKLSTMTHKLWAKRGIAIDSSTTPLNELNHPVVSVFSTGVLEAAIRGIPAWVYHPNPPEWLTEFWNRYGMSRWGSEPTAPPVQPGEEPAQQIAAIIAQKLEE